MGYPKKDTNSYKILLIILEKGTITENDLLPYVQKFGMDGMGRMRRVIRQMLHFGYMQSINGNFYMTDEMRAYIEDCEEIEESKRGNLNITQSAYRNIWTKPMRGYTAALYANKRGY